MLRRSLPFLAIAVFTLGCSQESPSSYKVPKEKEESMGTSAKAPADMPSMPSPSPLPQAGEGSIKWDAPKGWKAVAGSGMRLASFEVPGANGAKPADLSVVQLPGEAGGELANVNRWRGQVGLGPIDEKGLEKSASRVKSLAGTLLVVECAGPKGRMHAAILSANGNTWFFKLTGDDATLAAERQRFLGFLKSLRFA